VPTVFTPDASPSLNSMTRFLRVRCFVWKTAGQSQRKIQQNCNGANAIYAPIDNGPQRASVLSQTPSRVWGASTTWVPTAGCPFQPSTIRNRDLRREPANVVKNASNGLTETRLLSLVQAASSGGAAMWLVAIRTRKATAANG
jgi:hypothetical protein